jgi:hypothetical protein
MRAEFRGPVKRYCIIATHREACCQATEGDAPVGAAFPSAIVTRSHVADACPCKASAASTSMAGQGDGAVAS